MLTATDLKKTQKSQKVTLSAITAPECQCDVVGYNGNALVLLNEVNISQARLVLGWVTVSEFYFRRRHYISLCNQPPRSTQPATLRGTVK